MEVNTETWANKNELFDGDYEGWDDPDIKRFISDFVDYYDTMQYLSVYKCKACGQTFVEDKEDAAWFSDYGEESLWGHLQLEHPDIFVECRDLETPFMLEEYYEHSIEKVSSYK